LIFVAEVAAQNINSKYFMIKVDPSKMDKGDDAKKNFKRLTTILDQLLQKIYASADLCPT
jgi:hypothetical protein